MKTIKANIGRTGELRQVEVKYNVVMTAHEFAQIEDREDIVENAVCFGTTVDHDYAMFAVKGGGRKFFGGDGIVYEVSREEPVYVRLTSANKFRRIADTIDDLRRKYSE